MRILEDPKFRTLLIIGLALTITLALVLILTLGLVILFDNPPLMISELALFEVGAFILWIGALVMALFIYYRLIQR